MFEIRMFEMRVFKSKVVQDKRNNGLHKYPQEEQRVGRDRR